MEKQMTALRDEDTLTAVGQQAFAQEGGQSARPNFGYYRKTDGEITVDAVSEMEELHYRREGWEPMPQYGRFDMTTEWMTNHPFEALFMHGGAVEMPLKQVIDNGFHLNAPEVPGCGKLIDQNHPRHRPACWQLRYKVSFPQLEGSDAQAWTCNYCSAIRATKAGLDNHMEAVHREERGDLRTAHSLAEAIVSGLKGKEPASEAAYETDYKPPVDNLAVTALQKLASAGLSKKQLEVLAEMGVTFDEATEGSN